MSNLQSIINEAFEHRAQITPRSVETDVQNAVLEAIDLLDTGKARVADKQDGRWVVNQWLKKAVLLYFRIEDNQFIKGGYANYWDKVPSKFADYNSKSFRDGGFRVVPPAAALLMAATFAAILLPGCGGGSGGSTPSPPSTAAPIIVVGTDASGVAHNSPTEWPVAAGNWNGKGARYHRATDRLVFETYRDDIRGGSIPDSNITAAGVTEYFRAGPGTGTSNAAGTTVLYVANGDGSNPSCLGCMDVIDGQDGVAIYKVLPSADATANTPVRQTGATVYANQNKDLAAWHPGGNWLIAGIELPQHALTHALGNAEVGLFNDLWAISVDGKTWVQLTDYAATWTYKDAVAQIPYACAQVAANRCPTACQYRNAAPGGAIHPFDAYSCSAAGAPPPASGTMRPTLSHGLAGDVSGSAKLVWAERVGISPSYVWGGVLQIATADIVMQGGLPTLVNYRRNITPTPSRPDGQGLWSNPGGNTVIGAGYEVWSFSEDDSLVTFASDVFLSTSDPAVTRSVSPGSQLFTDAIAWRWRGTPSLANLTAYDPLVYNYADNAAPYPISKYGHWEEPVVPSLGATPPFYAFASSANLAPTWDPYDSAATLGLETWIVRADRSAPAVKLTHFNEPAAAPHTWAYPTAMDAAARNLYLTVVPALPGGNPPGAIYSVHVPEL
jgi:hypothetical protein